MRRLAWLTCVVFSGCVTAGAVLDDTSRETLLFGEIPEGPWREVSAPGFTLVSDVSAEQLQEAAQTIAQAQTAVGAMLATPRDPRVVHVVLYASRFDFEAVHGKVDSELVGDTLFVCRPLHEWLVLDAFAQVRIRDALPYRPHWLGIGLAADLSTLRWKTRNLVQAGLPNPQMYAAYLGTRSVDVRQLHTWFGGDDPHSALSGLSWALVRWAATDEPKRFATYLRLLAEGDAQRAWAETFAPLASHLDRDVYRFIIQGRFASTLHPVPDAPHVDAVVRVVQPPAP